MARLIRNLRPSPKTIAATLADLAERRVSSRELTEEALAAADAEPRAFIVIDHERARAAAARADALLEEGNAPALAGVPITIKNNIDVQGLVTTAGSQMMPPVAAAHDAQVVARLRKAGCVVVGVTHMSEFAFSGLGLNPHLPRLANPWASDRVPGGSSSGAAAAIVHGSAVASIGTDTGGSVRVPAAFCGLTGFKPTGQRVSRRGVIPLSPSLDSVGAIGRSVDCCRRIDAVMSVGALHWSAVLPAEISLGVLGLPFTDGLQKAVSNA